MLSVPQNRDKLVEAIVRVLGAYGFQVRFTIRGTHTEHVRVTGDSGISYLPDMIAQRGRLTIVCDARTRGQRGRSRYVDRGAVQLLQAVLDDMVSGFQRPQGMIVTPHGVDPDAKRLAHHFGIHIATIPPHAIERLVKLSVTSEGDKIKRIANRLRIGF